MPNTLIHLGVQGLLHRGLDRRVDLRLVYLGAIIPDLPWIAQRAIRQLWPDIDRIDLALYCGAQSSLGLCLVLSAALASLTRESRSTFVILAAGSLVHLGLDITQVKWGNGAIFLAPFSWQITSLAWAWPEHPLFTWLTYLSLGIVLATWPLIDHRPLWVVRGTARWFAASALLVAYLAAPVFFIDDLLAADTYDAATLRDATSRTGHAVAFDRAAVIGKGKDYTIARIFTGETIHLAGVAASPPALISVKGEFTSTDTVRVDDFHLHPRSFRDYASMAGLGLFALIWLQSSILWMRHRRR